MLIKEEFSIAVHLATSYFPFIVDAHPLDHQEKLAFLVSSKIGDGNLFIMKNQRRPRTMQYMTYLVDKIESTGKQGSFVGTEIVDLVDWDSKNYLPMARALLWMLQNKIITWGAAVDYGLLLREYFC